MTRKAVRQLQQKTSPTSSRPHAIAVGALLASATFTTLNASNAPAFEPLDARLAVIDRGLSSHASVLRDVVRHARSQQSAFQAPDTESLSQNTANNGRRLTLAPKYSGSAWMTYKLPKNFTAGGGVRATSEVFINAANTIKAPGYGVMDGLVEYAVNEHLTLRLNIYNLTNTRYIRNVNNNGGRYNPGNPRTAQITSTISF